MHSNLAVVYSQWEEAIHMDVRKRLTARRKFELYLETRAKDADVGEILRRYGIHLNDLRQIEAAVERAAVEALKSRRNGMSPGAVVGAAEHAELVEELTRKEKAMSELIVEYTLLKKSEKSDLPGRWKAYMSAGRSDRR